MSSGSPHSNEEYSSLEVDLRGNDTQKVPVFPGGHTDTHKESVSPPRKGYIAAPLTAQESNVLNSEHTHRVCGLRRRIFWAIVAVSAVCIIVAVVVGGVVGSSRNSTNDQDPSTNTPTPDSDSDPSPQNSTALASITFYDSQMVNHRRLYFQSADNVINEHAWNSTARKWYHMSQLGRARKNSPIAASVSYGSYRFVRKHHCALHSYPHANL